MAFVPPNSQYFTPLNLLLNGWGVRPKTNATTLDGMGDLPLTLPSTGTIFTIRRGMIESTTMHRLR